MLISPKFIYSVALALLCASSPALADTTFMSCKGGWNNPTWWGHAYLILTKTDRGANLSFSFDSKNRSFRSGADDTEYALSKDGFSAKFNFRSVQLTEAGNAYVWKRDDSIVGRTGNKISSGVIAGGVVVMKQQDEIARISDYEILEIDRTNLSLRYEMMDPAIQMRSGNSPRISTFQCVTATKEEFVASQRERLTKAWKKGVASITKSMNDAKAKPSDLKI